MRAFFQRLRRPRPGRLLLALGLAGTLGLAACSPMGGHAGAGWHRAAMDPGKMDERIDKMAERLMRELDGSPEQRAQVSSIAKAAARDMAPIAEQARSARKQAVELLKASTIDKAAVEALRAQQLNLADTASRRATQAMTEIAEVLTPEQRAKAARWMESRAERRRG